MSNKPLFRELRADELQVRKGRFIGEDKSKVELLVYKDARCDANVLDEVFGPFNWSCQYSCLNGTIYCGVGIRETVTGQFVWKWDAGAENENEKEKGTASDAFKRACFKFGLGRSLYTCPRVVVPNDKYASYKVSEIEYEDSKVTKLVIVDNKGNEVFHMEPGYTCYQSGPSEPEKQADGRPWNVRLKEFCGNKKNATEDPEEQLTILAFYYHVLPQTERGEKWGLTKLWNWFVKDLKDGRLIIDDSNPRHPVVNKR